MKASEHVRGRDTEDKVLFCVLLFRKLVDKALHSLLDLIVRFHVRERIGPTLPMQCA